MAGGRIPESVVADIRDRTDIVEIIGRHVELKRAGTNFKGLCPFHDEKTPSFNVNPQRQFFHCFGCQAGGDAIAFLMRLEGRTFVEVVEDLAERAGVEIPREQWSPKQRAAQQQARSDKQQALDLNERVCKLYRYMLDAPAGAPARKYLQMRGIGDEVSETFRLGYAPQHGEAITRQLIKHGIDQAFAEKMGLLVKRRKGTGYRDKFWNRLIFPVIGSSGQVLGFGGRLLDGDTGPKYMNTPETPIYQKGRVLYGLAQAAKGLRREEFAIVVEGNIDVIQLHQHGFDNAVAPMGTALTREQALLLKRFVNRVVALFDGDSAGQAAARKSVDVLLAEGLDVQLAVLDEGSDPDDLLRESGPSALQKLLDSALPAVDYLIEQGLKDYGGSIPERARLVERVAPYISRLPSEISRQLYIDKLAMLTTMDPDLVRRAVAGQRLRKGQQRDPGPGSGPDNGQAPPKLDRFEIGLLKILISQPRLLVRAEQANAAKLLTNDQLRATYSAAVAMQRTSGDVDASQLLQSVPPAIRDVVAQAALAEDFAEFEGDPLRALEQVLVSLVGRRIDNALATAKKRIAQADKGTGLGSGTGAGEGALDAKRRLIELQDMRAQLQRASEKLDVLGALVPNLIQLEQGIYGTQQ